MKLNMPRLPLCCNYIRNFIASIVCITLSLIYIFKIFTFFVVYQIEFLFAILCILYLYSNNIISWYDHHLCSKQVAVALRMIIIFQILIFLYFFPHELLLTLRIFLGNVIKHTSGLCEMAKIEIIFIQKHVSAKLEKHSEPIVDSVFFFGHHLRCQHTNTA